MAHPDIEKIVYSEERDKMPDMIDAVIKRELEETYQNVDRDHAALYNKLIFEDHVVTDDEAYILRKIEHEKLGIMRVAERFGVDLFDMGVDETEEQH